ncbi:MAG: hypothetical protein Q9186_004971 [Xanthomendoza sp. 1 TL-2023]
MGGVDVISVNVLQWSFVLLVCYDPRRTFTRFRRTQPRSLHKKSNNKNELPPYEEEAYPINLSKRIPWVLTLLISLRLTNWKTGHPSHDRNQPVKPISRTAFFTHAIILALQSFLILDLTSLLTQQDPYFHIPNTSITSPLPPPIPHILTLLLPPRLIRTTILALQSYALITQGGSLPTLPILLLNTCNLWPDEWTPHTWPIFFGPFSAVTKTGLRGLWGRWWHQTNRYLATPGRVMVAKRVARTKDDAMTAVGYLLQVVSAFGLSGFMHMGLIPPEPQGTEMSAGEMRMYVAGFFWMQAVGIGCEVSVARIFRSRRWNSSIWGRLGTAVWVMVWFSYTLPLLAIPFRELGYWTYPPLPISFVGWLLGKGWWVW